METDGFSVRRSGCKGEGFANGGAVVGKYDLAIGIVDDIVIARSTVVVRAIGGGPGNVLGILIETFAELAVDGDGGQREFERVVITNLINVISAFRVLIEGVAVGVLVGTDGFNRVKAGNALLEFGNETRNTEFGNLGLVKRSGREVDGGTAAAGESDGDLGAGRFDDDVGAGFDDEMAGVDDNRLKSIAVFVIGLIRNGNDMDFIRAAIVVDGIGGGIDGYLAFEVIAGGNQAIVISGIGVSTLEIDASDVVHVTGVEANGQRGVFRADNGLFQIPFRTGVDTEFLVAGIERVRHFEHFAWAGDFQVAFSVDFLAIIINDGKAVGCRVINQMVPVTGFIADDVEAGCFANVFDCLTHGSVLSRHC